MEGNTVSWDDDERAMLPITSVITELVSPSSVTFTLSLDWLHNQADYHSIANVKFHFFIVDIL